MNPKRILVALLLALAVSGACTWLVSKKLTTPRATQRLADTAYAAPSMALQAGEVLGPGNTELIAWPGNIPLDGAFSRTAEVTGRAVLFPLGKGQPILIRDLTAAGSGNGLASKIPDGMRAVALRTDEVVGVGGFLVPGSHLDVLVTYRPDGPNNDPITVTVLQNVVVLAAGHQVEPDPEGKTLDVTVMTLLLTPEEAQRAVLASTQGTIHFDLRNGGDVSTIGAPSILLSQLAGRPAAMGHASMRAAAPAAAAKPKSHEIETILGGSSEEGPGKAQDGGAGQ